MTVKTFVMLQIKSISSKCGSLEYSIHDFKLLNGSVWMSFNKENIKPWRVNLNKDQSTSHYNFTTKKMF